MQTKYLLPILLILITQSVLSQNKKSFIESQQTIPFQKLYLHTDHEFYFLNDTIWFAGYLLHPQTHAPLKTDCNLYIELTDSSGHSVQKEFFPIEQGFCPGQLTLNRPELEEGNYLLRAYTDLLGEYGDDLIFSKPIRISRVKNTAGHETKDKDKHKIINNITIDLFPEGGFLLAGKYNQMAFKATEPSGRDVEIHGRLLNGKGEELMKFSSLYRGMGIIYFIPEQREKYTIEIDGYPNVIYNFPKISDTGAKLMIYKENPDGIDVNVLLNEAVSNQKYYVTSLTRGELNSFAEVSRNKKEKIVHIKNELLKNGINRVVLLNENFKPVSERLVFIDEAEDASLKLKLNQFQFRPREQVKLEIDVSKNIDRNEIANLSISVIDKSSIPESGITENIKSYLLIDSELKGYIASPADYFINEPQISSAKKLDLLMMTQGWSNYVWNTLTKRERIPEIETHLGHTFTGTLKNYYKTKKLTDSEVILSVSGKTDNFMNFTQTDSLGNYTFDNVQFYDSAIVFIQGKNKRDKLNTTITLDSILFSSPETTSSELTLAKHFTKIPVPMLRTKYFNEARLKEFFPDRDTRLIEEVRVTAARPEEEKSQGRIRIYTEPTHTVVLKENAYAYPNIMEYLAGRVPGRVDSTYLFLIDGIEVFSTDDFPAYDYVTSIPVGDIERVEILKHAAGTYYGMRGRNGVINIIIKRGGGRTSTPDILKGTIVKRIKGFSSYREFYSPAYNSENIRSEIPDYRTTLYWNPSIAVEDGKVNCTFFTCDNVAEYKIFVEGITENGTICLGEAEFEAVKNNDTTSENY
ncbi:TonB-dependent receptor [Maribellus maritimus]|uniref:TonB-dependent receptor n=1 Tax=Maribellus maritimus TaxID=2870838 RepID=UPI001EEC4B8B|nr:TonB-dependent receptor plug domain-containing protein [Maribellus maritimus]MCG6187893.1 hypothetical protein [Maribellus maritimus]